MENLHTFLIPINNEISIELEVQEDKFLSIQKQEFYDLRLNRFSLSLGHRCTLTIHDLLDIIILFILQSILPDFLINSVCLPLVELALLTLWSIFKTDCLKST